MTSNTILIPSNYNYTLANVFSQSFSNSNYYLFIGDFTTHANLTVQPVPSDVFSSYVEVYRNMIQGKQIADTDVCLTIRNIPYESKVFSQYDDSVDLSSLDFYAIVNASSYYHVYKCLDNNGGAESTVEPNFADISGANTRFYRTSDGYVWKYMYSADSTT